jgi:hypothetical protein
MNEQKKERHHTTMTPAELAEWDAEIEADVEKAEAATKQSGRRKRARRHIGCPWEFYADVCRLTRGRTALTVALYVYRQTQVRRHRTVTLSGVELVELGVHLGRKWTTLRNLEDVGIVRLRRAGPGQRMEVTLLWRSTSP